jgi:hypothetical protein
MKKILHFIWITMLITSANAAEVLNWQKDKADDRIRTLRAQLRSAKEYREEQEMQAAIALSLETAEKEKEAATKRAIMCENAALRQEQREGNQLLDEVLRAFFSQESTTPPPTTAEKTMPILHSADLKPVPGRISTLTAYQQEFEQDWNNGAGRIGPKAWEALGSENPALASVIAYALRVHQGKALEIFCHKSDRVTFRINGKPQDRPYTIR